VEPFRTVAGPVSVLLRNDVDTDQKSCPSTRSSGSSSGFGEFLFQHWAQEPGWELRATRSW
jgi:3-isopropylmalate dehydratase small subunit